MNGHQRCDLDAEYLPKLEAAMARGAVAAAAPAAAEGAPWYAVQSVPRGEWTAMRELAGLGMEAFLPHVREKRAMRGRFIAVAAPLFPGYLFARIGDGGFEAVRQADGVLGVVRVAERFAPLPGGVVEALLAECDVDGCLKVTPAAALSALSLAVGDVVLLTSGPFCGRNGPVISVDKAGRFVVHIDIFGRSSPVTVSSGEFDKISSPRKRPRQKRR